MTTDNSDAFRQVELSGTPAVEKRPDTSRRQPTKEPKQPVIRPGQRTPYRKATRRQIEKRIDAAALLRDLGFSKCEIHRVFRQRYGVEWRQTDRYLARART